MYSPEMRRRAGQGLGNDRELLHMLTMDTGKSQKGHGGHQENIQLPETEGKLRLGFPLKRPNPSKKRPLGEQSLRLSNSQFKTQEGGEAWVGELLRGEGQDFSSVLWGWPFVPRNPSS